MADLFEESIVPDRILELLLAWTKVHYQDKMPEMFREKYLDHLKKYFIIGEMPAAVSVWMDTKDFSEVTKVQRRLLRSYENDFSKHAPQLLFLKYIISGILYRSSWRVLQFAFSHSSR